MVKKHRHVYVLLLLLCPLFAISQKPEKSVVDSLLSEISQAKADTNKVRLLDKLSYAYSTIDANEGIKSANEALKLAEEIKWKKGIALANADLSVNYDAESNTELALDFASKALKLYSELRDEIDIARVTANIGLIYLHSGNYSKTLEYEFKALKSYEELGDQKKKAIILENIGTAFAEQKNYAKAMEYYAAALSVNMESGNKASIARNLGNIATVFDAAGKYDSSLGYLKMALKTSEEIGNKNAIQINLENIGNVYAHVHDYKNALEYQMKALSISEEIGSRSSIGINHGNIGETYFTISTDTTLSGLSSPKEKAAYLALAIPHLEKAISICEEVNYPAPKLEFMPYLADAYSLSGNYKKAAEIYKKYIPLKDLIFSDQNKIQIARLESEREIEIRNRDLQIKDKQLQIKKLELVQKRDERAIYVISIILLGIIIGMLIKKMRASNRKLLIEKKQAETKLMDSEFRLKQAQAIAHCGNWTINFATGEATWSEETCLIYGLSTKDTAQTYDTWLSFVHTDDLDCVIEMTQGANAGQSNVAYFLRIVRRDGSIRHLFSQVQYEFDDSGKPVSMYGVVHDVTDVKKNEEEIRLSHERFMLVNMAMREAIMDWDITTDTTIWGSGFTELFGYQPGDFHRHLWTGNIHPEDKNTVINSFENVLNDPANNIFNADFRFLKADREVAYVQLRSIFIRDKNGKPVRAVGALMDITKLVEKTNAIEMQNVALKEIAWIQSHIVRAPLANLMGLTALLKDKEEHDIDERDLIDKIQTEAESLDQVIRNIVRKTEAVEQGFS